MLTHNVVIPDSTTRLMASSSFFGSIIASSYLPVETTDMIDTMLIYIANTPKSSGVYILVSIGLIAIGIAWAIVVPVIRVKTLRENSDFGFSRLIKTLTPCSGPLILDTFQATFSNSAIF